MSSEPGNQRPIIYYLSAITALLIWSTSFIGTKIAYATFPPITLGAARFLVASLVLGLVLVLKREFVALRLQDLGWLALSGLLGITLYFTAENIGVSLTTASNAALIVASYPAITALLELLIYKVRLSVSKVLGIGIAMFGVYLLSSVNGGGGGRLQILGNLLLVAAGGLWAFYNFTTRRVVNRYPAVTLSFYQTLAGTVAFIPLTFTERREWQAPNGISFAMLLYLGVLCSVVAFLLHNFGLRQLSAGTVVNLMNLVPVFGVAFSMLLLHETVSARQIAGGAIVIIGVMLGMKRPKNQTALVAPE